MLLTCRYVTNSNNTLLSSSRKQTQVNYCNDGSDNVLLMKSPFHHKQQLSLLQCNSRCSSCCNINSSSNSNDKFLTSQKEILGMLDSNSNNKVGSGNIKRSISQKIQRMQNEVSCRSIFNRNEYDNAKRYQSVDKKKDDLTMKGIICNRITRMLNKDRGNYFDKRNVNVSYKHRFMFHHHQSSMHKYNNTRSQFLYSFNNNNNSNSKQQQQQPVIYPKKYYNGKLINDTKPKPNAYQLLFNNNNTTTNINNNANTTATANTSTSNLRLNLINLSNI